MRKSASLHEQLVADLVSMADAKSAASELHRHLADPSFLEFLSSGDCGRDVALPRLMRVGPLADVLMAHPDEELHSEAANWLSEIEDEPTRVALIHQAAHDADCLVRACAAEAIADHAAHPTFAAVARHLLADDDVLVQSLAVNAAMQQGLDQDIRALLLNEPDDRVIARAHCAFAEKGEEASVTELYSLLANSDYIVRYTAINGLAALDDARASARLRDALTLLAAKDESRAVSFRAQEICRELGLVAETSPQT